MTDARSIVLPWRGVFLLVCALVLVPAAHAACPRPLTLGWEEAPPYQYASASGEVVGFDIEILSEVFDRMGCELVLREVPWERHKAELRAGTIDLAAGIAKVGDRETWLHYSTTYRFDVTSLWVLADRLAELDFTEVPEVLDTDHRLGYRRGYSHGGAFQELLAAPDGERHLQAVDSDEQNVEKLLRRRIAGFFGERTTIRPLLRTKSLLETIVEHPAEVYSGTSYVVFSRESVDRAVVEAFDEALESLRADGTYEEIRARTLD